MRTTLLALALMLSLPWWLTRPLAADFDSGCAAFEEGDYAAAREAWAPLAAEGHAQAQFRLGCLYTFGQGVPEDPAMALRLYRLAAEQGDADAQNNLGGMYAEGLGTEADPIEAYMWLELAATQGHAIARRNQTFLAETMTAAQLEAARERARQWQPTRR